jgi:hypothetical protein
MEIMGVVAGPSPRHDEWRLELARDLVFITPTIDRLSAITLTPEHDEQARNLMKLQRKLHGWILQSSKPHLVMLKKPIPPRYKRKRKSVPKRPFIVVENNERQYWYGFDDFDEAVLFMLKYS